MLQRGDTSNHMANITASATVTVGIPLLNWGVGGRGIGAYDAIDFYTVVPQTLFNSMVTGRDGFVKPAASWDLGLLDVNGTELTGGGYVRTNVTFAQGNFVQASPKTIQNAIVIVYGAATAAWTAAYNLGIYDHATGKLLQASPLNTPVNVNSGDTLQFASNNLTLIVPT
jgi:hypothetical protein